MILKVGSNEFSVGIATERLFGPAGDEWWALMDPDRQEILLSPDCPPRRRRRELRHEFWHAWRVFNPGPSDQESEAIMFANVWRRSWRIRLMPRGRHGPAVARGSN